MRHHPGCWVVTCSAPKEPICVMFSRLLRTSKPVEIIALLRGSTSNKVRKPASRIPRVSAPPSGVTSPMNGVSEVLCEFVVYGRVFGRRGIFELQKRFFAKLAGILTRVVYKAMKGRTVWIIFFYSHGFGSPGLP